MTTFITLIGVALLAAMVTSSWGDLQESSPARDIEGKRSFGPSPNEPLERQQRAARPPHRPVRPIRPIRPIRPHHRGRRSPSPIDRQRLFDPFHNRRRRSPSPIDRQRLFDPFHNRGRRSPSPIDRHRLHDPFHHSRGRRSPSPIVRPPAPPFRHPFHHHRLVRSAQPKISELEVTKGTYVCGDRICKMTPGEVPKNCPHGMCQYPLGPMDHLGHAVKLN